MSSHPLIGNVIERTEAQDWLEAAPTDWVERRLVELESVVARTRSEQARLLREIDRRQVPTGMGVDRSTNGWPAVSMFLPKLPPISAWYPVRRWNLGR